MQVKMYDCDVCLSAGSVNQWGFCEICGEEFEDPQSMVDWQLDEAREAATLTTAASGAELISISRDAA